MLKSSNWMQKEIALVEVKPSQKPKKRSPKSFAVPCNLLLSYFAGTTWTTAWEQMSLWGSSQKALPVPAFTWQPGHWRWATLPWIWVFFKPFNSRRSLSFVSLSPFQIPLPNRPHWFLLFGATEEEIQEICLKILQLYTRKKVWFFFMLGALSEGCSSEQELENLTLFETTAASLGVNKEQSLSGTPWIFIPLPVSE